ncbi:MAG: hypothetical protein IKE43_04195 [Coriobacteriales bacterium]|nr:hypothetical protein [Coriobacteriales bacterium]
MRALLAGVCIVLIIGFVITIILIWNTQPVSLSSNTSFYKQPNQPADAVSEDYSAYITYPLISTLQGELQSSHANTLGFSVTWLIHDSLYNTALQILKEYEDAGYSLYYDGYLDLFHSVWACVIAVPGVWVEYAIVDEREAALGPDSSQEENKCLLTVTRLGEHALEDFAQR